MLSPGRFPGSLEQAKRCINKLAERTLRGKRRGGAWKERRNQRTTMSAVAAAASTYLARRAAQKERVRILYRRALKDTLDWVVHRHLFYQEASELREKFEANRHVEDLDTIDRMLDEAEARFSWWRHPDPYIVPWAPGGSKFCRNPTPPPGIEIVYDFGKEDNA